MRFRKISSRINLTVLPIIIAATLLLVYTGFTAANRRINEETEQRMFARLHAEAAKISNNLSRNAAIAQALVSFAQSAELDDYLQGAHERFMASLIPSNPNTIGGGIWFEPYGLLGEHKYYGPYYFRKNGAYRLTHMYDSEEYDYPNTEWYLNGKASKGPIAWTEVYHDPVSDVTMLTGAQPFFDRQGKFLGTCTADMDVTDIRRIVRGIREGESGRGMLISSTGQYIAQADERAAKESGKPGPDPAYAGLRRELLGQDRGIVDMVLDDLENRVFFMSIPATGWTLAIGIEKAELEAPVRSLIATLLVITILALALMVFVVIRLSRHLHGVINTVNHFSLSAAKGNLDERITMDTGDEFDAIAASLNVMIENMQRMSKAKSDFLSRMSHEIRTPMNAIIGMSQIAKQTDRPEKKDDCLHRIEDSSKHLLGIVNDILDYSKVEAGKLTLDVKQFSLTQSMEFAASMFKTAAAEKGVDFKLVFKDVSHDAISTDPLRLNQVLMNLVSNAVKFTEKGGSVRVGVKELSHQSGKSVYKFEVRDTGIGIDPAAAERLFSPFSQADAGIHSRFGGTGLGLAISKSLVEMMGGRLDLDSKPGRGSTFSFFLCLPAAKEVRDEKEELCAARVPSFSGKRMLLVEDIEVNRIIVEELLAETGVVLEMATNGQEALELFLEKPAGHYDLILMDMQMPVMDGYTATREIRGSDKPGARTVPIVAMSANVMREDVDYAFVCGVSGYISKPLDQAEMYSRLEEELAGGGSRMPAPPEAAASHDGGGAGHEAATARR